MLSTDPSPPARRWDLLLPHRDRLYRLARTRLTGHQDAEDCVQEALLRAALYPGLDPERVGPFLTSVTLRLCVDVHRQRERTRRFVYQHSFAPETASGPEEEACAAAEGTWMLQQVQRLGGREREVILARLEGAGTREAAGRLGISVKAAEGAFTRARARLRRWHGASLGGV
ncbi:sigma-70 family RNA polymerase sigma factor [Streptomyces durbertensis]|uniref:Sigma-70 family RNA polymerase sigma factor n=1 Tax=Streptomyces durbertensis TaxID=2448886 RepID=A0ABR6EFC1_9ACTN|nr:sigma-70 family RNA polymerase sigma factor [Streptomyces durbertensis]MBB1244027.1 sigma-70 family RNA polymerase sigma factor [Streptomyces durbertensis]